MKTKKREDRETIKEAERYGQIRYLPSLMVDGYLAIMLECTNQRQYCDSQIEAAEWILEQHKINNEKISYDGKTPPHYYVGKYYGIHAEKVVQDFDLSYNVGTAVTYLLRAGKKPDNPMLQDLKKALHHLNMEIEHLEKTTA